MLLFVEAPGFSAPVTPEGEGSGHVFPGMELYREPRWSYRPKGTGSVQSQEEAASPALDQRLQCSKPSPATDQ